MSCRNYYMANVCVAFPEGIPEDITFGKHDHNNPYSGDSGIQFERSDDFPEGGKGEASVSITE